MINGSHIMLLKIYVLIIEYNLSTERKLNFNSHVLQEKS